MNSLYKLSRKRILALYASTIVVLFIISNIAAVIVNNYYQEQFINNENEKFVTLFQHTLENDSIDHALTYAEHYTHVNDVSVKVTHQAIVLFESERMLRNAKEYQVLLDDITYTIKIDNSENSILVINNREADFITIIIVGTMSVMLLYLIKTRRVKNRRVLQDIQKIEHLMIKNKEKFTDFNYIELQKIYDGFNHKINTIDLMEEKRKDNLNGLVHDLKTPVTILLNHLEDVSTLEDLIINKDAIKKSLEDLSSTASDLISENFMGTKKKFNLSNNLTRELENYVSTFKSKNITLKQSVASNVMVYWNHRDFGRVLRNLLTNAYYYSDPNTTVYVHLLNDKENYTLKVINTGQKIEQEDLHRIFEKNSRRDENENTDGNGLGLYITKLLVEEINAKIYAVTNENESTFIVEFKK